MIFLDYLIIVITLDLKLKMIKTEIKNPETDEKSELVNFSHSQI